MKIIFLINSLQIGGAEKQLLLTAVSMSEKGHDVTILTFYPKYDLIDGINLKGVKVSSFDKKGRWDILAFIWKFPLIVKRINPDLVYSFLPVPNLLSTALKILRPNVKVMWRLAASDMDLTNYDWSARIVDKMQILLSSIPDAVIANSYSGKRHAQAKGFKSNAFYVIQNGFNTNEFYKIKESIFDVRKEWGTGKKSHLIGMVGRIDPVKGHTTFIKMAKVLHVLDKEIRFICIGDGSEEYRNELIELTKKLGISDVITWISRYKDMNIAYNAMDCLCLTSESEGFPNVVAEAILAGTLVVSTNVGDVERILGGTEMISETNDPRILAELCLKVVSFTKEEKKNRIKILQDRIKSKFPLDNVSNSSLEIINNLLLQLRK